jgi:predicted phosphoribosyltransferase
MKLFQDRSDAGEQLGRQLFRFADEHPVILALPRGGMPVGYAIAKLLHAPLGVLIARKIGLPGHPEYGVGAIAEGNVEILDEKTLKLLGISASDLSATIREEEAELDRRAHAYREDAIFPWIKGQTVILVDDGLATGVTARAAIAAVKKLQPKKIIFASPVCAYDSARQVDSQVDETVCLATPLDFIAVGAWYAQFPQVTDEEVRALLSLNRQEVARNAATKTSRPPLQGGF